MLEGDSLHLDDCMDEGGTHSPFLSSILLCGGHETASMFHSHFPPLIDADTLVLHPWEETFDDSLLEYYSKCL